MNLKDLKAMGLVTSNPLVKKTIEIQYHALKNPEIPEEGRHEELTTDNVDIWLRKYSSADVLALTFARSDTERAYIAIQRSIFNEDGSPMFTMDESLGLDLVLFAPMLKAIREMNPSTASKKSQPGKSFGAKSRSPSAARASQNGKTALAKKKRSSGANTARKTAR